MANNKKLIELREYIEELAVKIDKTFVKSSVLEFGLREAFMEILALVDNVSLAAQDQEPQVFWEIKVKGTTEEILSVEERMAELDLLYEVSKQEQKNEDRTNKNL